MFVKEFYSMNFIDSDIRKYYTIIHFVESPDYLAVQPETG